MYGAWQCAWCGGHCGGACAAQAQDHAGVPAAMYMAVWVPSPSTVSAVGAEGACISWPQWYPADIGLQEWQEGVAQSSVANVTSLQGPACAALSDCSTDASSEVEAPQGTSQVAWSAKETGLLQVEEDVVVSTVRQSRRQRQARSKRVRDPAPLVPLRAAREIARRGGPTEWRLSRGHLPWGAIMGSSGMQASATESNIVSQAFDPEGCRSLQRVLQESSQKVASQMAFALKGSVRQALESPHANHVIQAIIVLLPAETCSFVPEEILGCGEAVARHRYGCRVLCRLVEHHAEVSKATGTIIDEVLSAAGTLCRNEFGKHVLKSILEHGSDLHRHRIAHALCAELLRNATHRAASYVVEHALEYTEACDRDAIARQLTCGPEVMFALARSQAGCHVIRSLLKTPEDASRQRVLALLQEISPQLQPLKYGRLLVEELQAGATSKELR